MAITHDISATPVAADLQRLLDEDKRRCARFGGFDPISGRGSVGERVRVSIPYFPIPVQWLPPVVASSRLVRALAAASSWEEFFAADPLLGECTDQAREVVVEQFVRLRSLHDFPFWAATFVYIKRKGGGPDCLFRLTYPQRRFVERLEQDRLASRPIRIVLLKARQWGGSTTLQIYMAWLQLVHKVGLNSLIVSQVLGASLKIKEMFRRMITAYPVAMLHPLGASFNPSEPKMVRLGGSDSTQSIPSRSCSITVGTAEEPDSVRAGDYSLVHLSEVGLWKATLGKKPEDIVQSACSGVLYRPYTLIVYESTAKGVGNFFHNEYLSASDPNTKSQFSALFVPWFDIELYRLPFESESDRLAFARSLIDGRTQSTAGSERQEPGAYLWRLWERGATLEGIHWYVEERAKYRNHGSMSSEYPSDDVEAFVNSGSNVFDRYLVEDMMPSCREPRFIGEVAADAAEGAGAVSSLRFVHDPTGSLWVWDLPELPEPGDTERMVDRYLTVVDVGGRSDSADWSVVCVFDRAMMLSGGRPQVVAQWRGHCDIDILAWRAAQIAAFYDESLLVIESNTIESRDRERHVEGGDQSLFILNQIRDVYPNLYARRRSEEDIRQGRPTKYGFHTNAATKPMVISTLIRAVRERLYVERDRRCLAELLSYERKPSGAYGAIDGQHDDLLMTRAIGLHVCFNEMDQPRMVAMKAPDHFKRSGAPRSSMAAF